MPYTKDRSKYFTDFMWVDSVYLNGGLPFRSGRVIKLVQTRTGESLRGWKDRIRKGQNATTGMTGVMTTLETTRGYMFVLNYRPPHAQTSVQVPSGRETVSGEIALSMLPSNYDPPDSPNSKAYDRASSAAYKAVRQAQVSVSGPTFLGEARETMKMLRRPAEGIQNLARDWLSFLRKKKKANPRGWTKDISSAWLEHSFGWQPLLADARDAAKAWNRLFDEPRNIPFSGFGTEATLISHASVAPLLRGGAYTYFSGSTRGISTRLVKIRGMVKATAKTGGRAQLELFGFTPSEFLPTAWELLPWSFLVDYFTNIGDIISSAVTDTSGIAWCSRADIAEYEWFTLLAPDAAKVKSVLGKNAQGRDDNIIAEGRGSTARWKRRTISRANNFGLTVPNLTFELPGSNGQLLNIAALLGQANALHPQRRR